MTRGSVALHDVTRAVVALIASCALWLVVSGDERGAAWVPVAMELAEGNAVGTAEGTAEVVVLPNPVRAFVIGRRRDFIRLLQSPPVLRRSLTRNPAQGAITGTALDSVRIELRPADVVLPNGTEARVNALQPRALVVHLPREPRT